MLEWREAAGDDPEARLDDVGGKVRTKVAERLLSDEMLTPAESQDMMVRLAGLAALEGAPLGPIASAMGSLAELREAEGGGEGASDGEKLAQWFEQRKKAKERNVDG